MIIIRASFHVVHNDEDILASRRATELCWGKIKVKLNGQIVDEYYRCSGRIMAAHYQFKVIL